MSHSSSSRADDAMHQDQTIKSNRGHFLIGAAAVIGGSFLLPHLLSMSLAIDIVILAIAATAFNLMLGYTGLLSFGQAAFFAIGGYAAGNVLLHLGLSAIPTILLSGLAGAAASAIVGFLTLRLRNVYFILMTLAFAQLIYFLALSWREVTGGASGLRNFSRPELNLGVASLSLESATAIYIFAVRSEEHTSELQSRG